ncbi:adenylate kinase family protein [Candidatus Woesearchaeota archaeon]|nr:adenylate kinase family protein [Candidatus Woesearchaeota archaeon]
MKTIVVTGTPCTGKTTYAKRLAREKGYLYVDVNNVISGYKLSEGYDMKRKSKIVDTKKLAKALIDVIKKAKLDKEKGIVIDSHLSHYLPKKYADLCIVTRCDLKVLKKRLEKRGYSKQKVQENLEAEIFGVCLEEAKQLGHKVKVIYTSK